MSNAMHEPTPLPGQSTVADKVIEDINERVSMGLSKYGTKLMTFNGRNALVDLYQELIDATMYVKQLLMEEEAIDKSATGYLMHLTTMLEEDNASSE